MTLLLTAVLLLPIQAQTCPPDLHSFEGICLTDAEWTAWPASQSDPVLDTPALVGKPLARSLVETYFPPWAVNDAMKVVGCETGWTFNPWSKNRRSGASGLFQHMPRYWSARSSAAGFGDANIFDPEANVAVAAWLWGQTETWRHWSCKP